MKQKTSIKFILCKYFVSSLIGTVLLTGCASPEKIMLSKLKDSDWYKSQVSRTNKINGRTLPLNRGYIFAGQIKEIRYDYYKKTISDIILSPSHCLLAPIYWKEWFCPDPIRLDASNEVFKNGYFPTVGEYWAFGVIEGIKGRYRIVSTVKLFSDTNSSNMEK